MFGKKRKKKSSEYPVGIVDLVNTDIIHHNQEAESEVKPDEPEEILVIKFAIDAIGQISIHTKWDNQTEILSKAFGRLLYQINQGDFREELGELLINIAQNHPNQRHFLEKVFESWAEELEGDPVIKPIEVFGLSNVLGKKGK